MNNFGFTLTEVLLSVAAIAIVGGTAIPVFLSFQVRNDLDIAAVEIVQTLRRAQVLAQAVDGDISWGVFAQGGSITLFKGASYAARDIDFDEVFEAPASIVPSGVSEIVFTKFSGMPQSSGTIILISSNNETRNIVINQKGMVNY